MKKICINGINYAYSDIGEGPAIVFAHGLFVDHSIFEKQVVTLCETYRCISIDLPGHGQSEYYSAGWTLDDLADDMAALIDLLELEKVVFIGLSQGGMIGLRLAARYPHLVSKLILVGASARAESRERIPVWKETLTALMVGSDVEREETFHTIQGRILDAAWLTNHPLEAKKERRIMLSHNKRGIELAATAAVLTRQDIRPELPKIAAPTLVIVGENDNGTPPILAEEMQALIPNAQLLVIPNSGHHLPIERPQCLTDAMQAFIG